MRRRLAVMLSTVALLMMVLAVPARAVMYYNGNNCTQYAELWGNANLTPGPNQLRICYSPGFGVNLRAIHDLFDSNCAGFLGIDDGDWEDCVTSVKVVSLPVGWFVCYFNAPSASKAEGWFSLNGGWINQLSWQYNDKLSSIWFTQSQTCTI